MSKQDWIKCAWVWQNTGDVFLPSMWMDAGLKVAHVNECIQEFDNSIDPDNEQSPFHTSAQLAQFCCEKAGLA